MTPKNETPDTAATVSRVRNSSANQTDETTLLRIRHHLNGDVSFTFDGTGPRQVLGGRAAWAFRELVKAGTRGCTPITNPAPRWAAYVHKLRHKFGIPVETIHEAHGKPFPGTHARYILHATVIEDDGEMAA